MKNRTFLLAMVILAFCRPSSADWRIDTTEWMKYCNYPDRSKPYRGSFATESECQKAMEDSAREMNDAHFVRLSKCIDFGGNSGYSGGTPEQQLVLGILGSILDSIFEEEPDTSVQDAIDRQNAIDQERIERQNAIKLQQAKEEKRQRDFQAWRNFLNKEKEKIDDDKNLAAGKGLLTKNETVGGGELKFKTIGTNFFGTGNPSEIKLQPIGTNSYPTSDFTALNRLRCAAYFFDAAKKSEDYENARFLGEQADKVIQGQATNVECKLAALPDVPEPSDPEKVDANTKKLANILSSFQKDVKFLQDIEIKLYDSKVQIKEAESKKEAAQIKLEEVRNIAATAKPEEKPQDDGLLAEAQAALQSAEGELVKAKQAENDLIKEKENVENDLKNMNAKIQAGSK